MTENNVKKLVLMGIANSGKSSIALCLKGVNRLDQFTELKPNITHKIDNFETLGTDFSIWDFPGQEKLRSEPIQNFDSLIKNANKIIYVVDVQDKNKYSPSLEYMKQILDLIVLKKMNLKFSIFLHKFDSDIKTDKHQVNDLLRRIRESIPQNLEVSIFKTSIYTTFQKSAV